MFLKKHLSTINTVTRASGLRTFLTIVSFTIGFSFLSCINQQATEKESGPSPAKSPDEELSTFELPEGLKIQLVASEPMIQDPVVITFDADGRLWVVEMRGFMPDIDGKGEKDPVGRISVLEDVDGDGRMDVSEIYMDSLVLPRAIALVPGGVLVAENKCLWLTQDLDNDLHADAKTLIDSAYAGGESPEHSGNGLMRNIDNWYYNVKSRFRYRLVDKKWERDSTEFRGQWGLSHDDEGRLYYNYNWSQLHADLVPPNYLSRNRNHTPTTGIDHGLTNDRRIYPIRSNPAVNRGYIPGIFDEKGRLLEFTAACSPFFYRETGLPKEYYGNVFVCEPSGNLIKRDIVEENGVLLMARDATPGREFLASTDERFRPVYLATGPDGALYVADMYRGLIQHGSYVTPYLRKQTIERKLVEPVNLGRIWRIVAENPSETTPMVKQPKKLSAASSAELIATLSHPNGWYRDMAQRLLVERGDQTISKQLSELALKGNNQLARLHALWTMEGLKLTDPGILFQLMDDSNSVISSAAIRLLEPIAKQNKQVRQRLQENFARIQKSAGIKQLLQVTLTANSLDQKYSEQLLAFVAERYDTSALVRDAILSSLQDREFAFLQTLWKSPSWQNDRPSREILLEMLTTSIIRKRNPRDLSALLSMLASNKDSFDWKQEAVLTGISIQGKTKKIKPVFIQSAPALINNNQIRNDQSRLYALMALFEWPGHIADTTTFQERLLLSEKDQKQFVSGRQLYLTACAGCHGTDGEGLKRFAPSLIGSDWVLGSEKRLALILLHGMEGPVEVNGKIHDAPDILPVMPAHSTLDDGSISSILTYIRNEWGNSAGPVSSRTVGIMRLTSQGRVIPWTASELNKHMLEITAKDNNQEF